MYDVATWALIALAATLVFVHRRRVAAIWARTEDPRTVAVFRVCVGALLLLHLLTIAPLYGYLYAGDGLFTGEQARELFGRRCWSPLYRLDSPGLVEGYRGVQLLACVAFMIGLATPVTKWLTWALLLGMLGRNAIDAGGDHVFASFLFYLCLSRCGESYSVDAWLRRRRAPERATHSPIPGWPRNLMLLQMVPMMTANGLAKSNQMWRDGDTFYYILNHAHFRPAPMWALSEHLGTNVFRVMTWGVHAFEILFVVAILGRFWAFGAEAAKPEAERASRWSWLLWFALGVDVIVLAVWTWGARVQLPHVLTVLAGVALALAPLSAKLARRLPSRVRRVVFGPGLWAAGLAAFGGVLFVGLRVGTFTGVVMCSAILLFDGELVGRRLAALGRARSVSATRPAAGPEPRPEPRPGPWRRRFVGLLSAIHVLAVTAVVLPHPKPTPAWRDALERPLRLWITQTVRGQWWRMFTGRMRWREAELEVVLVDAVGEVYVVGDGFLGVDDGALDRREKAGGRVIRFAIYREPHARWVCRNFELPDGGHDFEVRMFAVQQPMPEPDDLAHFGRARALADVEASRRRKQFYAFDCTSD